MGYLKLLLISLWLATALASMRVVSVIRATGNELRNFDEVMRITPKLSHPLSRLPHHANGKTLKLDRFNVHLFLYTSGLRWHQDSNPLFNIAGYVLRR
ncbi:hypothetical protein TNCV_1703271 [Trichonephila clavipes]|nr:hypothetical protein TNCV_1703271 [Trichonephila clavipes]